ncbi:hypothetical protein Tco_0747654 [Tanacetum coccineum]|uniref:Uncharacterized protein n=1 Tax=Tanacetum coccineum TaxID=301880 RepID=A0ABQ4YWU2_9ASTR
MDLFTKNVLWDYWKMGDDEIVLTNGKVSDLKEEYPYEDGEIAKIFRIESNIFNYETPLCKAFNEFNYIFQIDPDVLIKDIIRFKTYEEYKDDWIYERNKDVSWVHEKPWTENEAWKEPTHVKHYCELFSFKSGHTEWPTCSWKDDGYYNGGNLPGTFKVSNTLHYQDLKWYEALKDGKLKDGPLKNKAILEGLSLIKVIIRVVKTLTEEYKD